MKARDGTVSCALRAYALQLLEMHRSEIVPLFTTRSFDDYKIL